MIKLNSKSNTKENSLFRHLSMPKGYAIFTEDSELIFSNADFFELLQLPPQADNDFFASSEAGLFIKNQLIRNKNQTTNTYSFDYQPTKGYLNSITFNVKHETINKQAVVVVELSNPSIHIKHASLFEQLCSRLNLQYFEYHLVENCFYNSEEITNYLELSTSIKTLKDFFEYLLDESKILFGKKIEKAINYGEHLYEEVTLGLEKGVKQIGIFLHTVEKEGKPTILYGYLLDITSQYHNQQSLSIFQHIFKYQEKSIQEINIDKTENDIKSNIFSNYEHSEVQVAIKNLKSRSKYSNIIPKKTKDGELSFIPIYNYKNELSKVITIESTKKLSVDSKINHSILEIINILALNYENNSNISAKKLGEFLNVDQLSIYLVPNDEENFISLSKWKNPNGKMPIKSIPMNYSPENYPDLFDTLKLNQNYALYHSSNEKENTNLKDLKTYLFKKIGINFISWHLIYTKNAEYLIVECMSSTNLNTSDFHSFNLAIIDFNSKQIGYSESDISRKTIKKIEEEKQLLIKETNHRAKNNLAILAGLMKIEAANSSNPEVKNILKEFQGRIKSMSFLHEQLYKNDDDLSQIDTSKYINQVLDSIIASFSNKKVDVIKNIEPHQISSKKAIVLGLLINELVTNAYKHAFGTEKKGELNISFNKTDDTNFRLEIQDNGNGLPLDFDIEKLDSLGFTIIREFTLQLKGKLSFETMPGSKFTINFPQ